MSLFDPDKYRVFPLDRARRGQLSEASTFQITHKDLVSWLTRTVTQNRSIERPTGSQQLLDQLAAQCLAEGEIALGNAVVALHSLRVAGHADRALQLLLQLLLDARADGTPQRACRVCGCTEDRACEGGCSWVEFDLCSACAVGGG